MSNWKRYDRREMLNLLSMLGAMGAVSLLLGGCAPVTLCSGVRKVTGEVLINGQRITSKQLTATGRLKVPNDASLSTGPDGSAVFVVGKDAFLLHKNSRVVLTPAASTKPNEISGFQLSFGAILSVFARGKRMLRTPTAVIAIPGNRCLLGERLRENLHLHLLWNFPFADQGNSGHHRNRDHPTSRGPTLHLRSGKTDCSRTNVQPLRSGTDDAGGIGRACSSLPQVGWERP